MSLAIRVLLLLFLAAPLVPPLPAHAQTTETSAVITELKPGRGRVEVKPAAGGDWKPARPLLALRAGDALRTSDNASAATTTRRASCRNPSRARSPARSTAREVGDTEGPSACSRPARSPATSRARSASTSSNHASCGGWPTVVTCSV